MWWEKREERKYEKGIEEKYNCIVNFEHSKRVLVLLSGHKYLIFRFSFCSCYCSRHDSKCCISHRQQSSHITDTMTITSAPDTLNDNNRITLLRTRCYGNRLTSWQPKQDRLLGCHGSAPRPNKKASNVFSLRPYLGHRRAERYYGLRPLTGRGWVMLLEGVFSELFTLYDR